MIRGKIKKATIIVSVILIALMCAKEFSDMKNYYISENTIASFLSGAPKEKRKAKTIIIKNVLTHMDFKGNELETYDAMNLAVFKANVRDKEDLLFALQINKGLSVIGAYTKAGNKYSFLAQVGTFTDIKEIQPIKLESDGRDLIAVRENIPFTDETREESTYIRIYYYDRGRFNTVLNVLERYKSYYNEIWAYPRLMDANWILVTQKADLLWENEYYPKITLKLWQAYGVSYDINSEKIPKDYDIISKRDFTNIYNWSSQYRHFILYEGIDIKTGKKLAVVEDLANNPYDLAPEVIDESGFFLVKYENGRLEKLEKSRVKFK